MSEPWQGKTEGRFSWLHLVDRRGHWCYRYRGDMKVDRWWVWDDHFITGLGVFLPAMTAFACIFRNHPGTLLAGIVAIPVYMAGIVGYRLHLNHQRKP